MIKTIKNVIMSLSAVFMLSAPMVAPVAVYAQEDPIKTGICGGTELQIGAACKPPGESTNKFNAIIKLIVNIFSVIVGVVAVIMIIVGGLKYITSGGDSGNVTGAKNTILYAVVGLIVVALAQFIVRFVLDKATNTSSTL